MEIKKLEIRSLTLAEIKKLEINLNCHSDDPPAGGAKLSPKAKAIN